MVNLLRKGDKADLENYRGTTLFSPIGKTRPRILNDRMGTTVENEDTLSCKGERGQGLSIAA